MSAHQNGSRMPHQSAKNIPSTMRLFLSDFSNFDFSFILEMHRVKLLRSSQDVRYSVRSAIQIAVSACEKIAKIAARLQV